MGEAPKPAKHQANRLSHETSPYLLQHAHNPVDWYPWGEEAFAEARRRDVPIFLSIGYSTCYWCHVMERECFENDQIARQMNEGFVCIKVDREERPDIDEIYMAGTLITTGQGGWPMSVFLMPDSLEPFLCGTFFPARPMAGLGDRPTFPQLMSSIRDAWSSRRSEVAAQAGRIADAVREELGSSRPAEMTLDSSQVADCVTTLLRLHDRAEGGFSRAPKFPQPALLEFLLDVRDRVDDAARYAIDQVVRLTLDRMGCGGIFDQVGGGFHRYSVDAFWTVPHFEKMLYDQAQIASVYARAATTYSDGFYRDVAIRTLDYVAREMTGEHGEFFSAQDAEVDSREGLNYLWTRAELQEMLAGDFEVARVAFALDAGENFKDPHHPGEPARFVLKLASRPDRLAGELGMTPAAADEALGRIRTRLHERRRERRQPMVDTKAIASWNGLMAKAFADASRLLDVPKYLQIAERAARFLTTSMRDADGRLFRTCRQGEARAPGVLEDYAGAALGILAIARAGRMDSRHVSMAKQILDVAIRDFSAEDGGVYDSSVNAPRLFVRPRTMHDGAAPCGTSQLLHALLDLGELTSSKEPVDRALSILVAIRGAISRGPVSTANSTRALLRLLTLRESLGPTGPAHEDSPASPARADTPRSALDFTPVEVFASVDRVAVAKDSPASLNLLVRIAPGYHIISADPGSSGIPLAPLRVGIVHGSGIAAYADYPEGIEYGVPDVGTVRVHSGEFELQVVLEATGDLKGSPLIAVTYQACSETSCLEPRTVELDVAIDG